MPFSWLQSVVATATLAPERSTTWRAPRSRTTCPSARRWWSWARGTTPWSRRPTSPGPGSRCSCSRRATTVGGNTRTEALTLPGFAHDSCSSAHVLIQNNPLVRDDELGLVAEQGLRYLTTDPAVVMPQPDGDVLVMRPDLAATTDELARWSARDARAFEVMVRAWRGGLGAAHGRWSSALPPARGPHHARLPGPAVAERLGRRPRDLRAPGGPLLRAVAGDGDDPGPAPPRDRIPPVLAGRRSPRPRLDDPGRGQPGAARRAGARHHGARRPGGLLGAPSPATSPTATGSPASGWAIGPSPRAGRS